MNIILFDGQHDRERWDNVSDYCRRYHRMGSFYEITDEVTDDGRRVFRYDKEASERRRPDDAGNS